MVGLMLDKHPPLVCRRSDFDVAQIPTLTMLTKWVDRVAWRLGPLIDPQTWKTNPRQPISPRTFVKCWTSSLVFKTKCRRSRTLEQTISIDNLRRVKHDIYTQGQSDCQNTRVITVGWTQVVTMGNCYNRSNLHKSHEISWVHFVQAAAISSNCTSWYR